MERNQLLDALLIAQSRRLIVSCTTTQYPSPELHITFNEDTPKSTMLKLQKYIETVYNYRTKFDTVWSVRTSFIEVLVVKLDND